jgi:contact-dependent growth inhibition (CDI) system CdiI-like immunity protein
VSELERRREKGEVPAPDFGGLALLLDGYFHQDFRTEHGDHEGAARAFAREASAVEAATAVDALERFLAWAETVPVDFWQEALTQAGGSWRPRSLGPIRDVLAQLRHAELRPDREGGGGRKPT